MFACRQCQINHSASPLLYKFPPSTSTLNMMATRTVARLAAPSSRRTVCQPVSPIHSRQLFGWTKAKESIEPPAILKTDNLFHPLSSSPIPALQQKARFIKEHANCPVCAVEQTRRPPIFDCPDCGFPTHCSHVHHSQDLEAHQPHCRILCECNMDEHDLRSGREMVEFQFPGVQPFDEAVSLGNWDVFLYTRSFPSLDSDRSLRHVSKVLTHPITIASVMHENSPYKLSNSRLNKEGLRSLTALRQNLHPTKASKSLSAGDNDNNIRIFILGARAEATLPLHVWQQLSHLFPSTSFQLHMIGPEVPSELVKESPTGLATPHAVSSTLSITYHRSLYHDVHHLLEPFDPYTDIFFTFSPGLGHPATRDMWKNTIPRVLDTKCLLVGTGFDQTDIERDVKVIDESGLEFDWAMPPGENVFGSRKWEVNDWNLQEAVRSNWGIWAVRGKLYEVRGEEKLV